MIASLLVLLLIAQTAPPRDAPFVIAVVDAETRRGIPLVELETLHHVRFVTDSAGLAAFDEPGLMNRDVYLTVRAFGYDMPKDGSGLRGKAFRARPGGQETLSLRRTNLAERIYRTTGAGIYRDTVLAGRRPPIRSPLLNGGVLGSDSVLSAVFGGKIYWFWGDTLRPGRPQANTDTPGATSLLPSRGGLDPDLGIDLQYDPDPSGFARATAKLPGDGPTWLTGLTVLHDASGRERMFATYDKVRDGATYRRGLVEWDEVKREFAPIAEIPLDAPIYPQGHPFLHTVDGIEYVYFAAPLPFTRVRATPEAFRDLAQYEALTPLPKGAKADARTVERDASGRVVYAWKTGTPPARSDVLDNLYRYRAINSDELVIGLQELMRPRPIRPHGGSVNWNAYRGRFVAIFVEMNGASPLGEVYFAEADTPVGPWGFARKVVSHADPDGRVSSFYNPKHHAFFDKDGGRTIFFEGTYSTAFSGSADPTPRYDYNQVIYKLDLGRPELSLPVPIYAATDAAAAGPVGPGGARHPERHGRPVLYFAPDRPGIPGTVPVFGVANAAGGQDLRFGGVGGELLFYAYPGDAKGTPATVVPLQEFIHDDGVRHAYSTDNAWTAPGFRRTGRILGYVWQSPLSIRLPKE